ncbi:MAG: AfsR/SARP family transcriptional regulator, partial [Dehalococcoidia bacterium]
MTLSLSLLGTPVVAADARPIEFDTRKAMALLAYLAVTGQPQSRESVAALLWPEYDAEHARAALRRTLSTARRGLDDRWLVTDRHAVRLQHEQLDLDVDRFRSVLSRPDSSTADLEEAVRLYRA